jgi:5-methylcytosine-specific restriction endonuclease McrA
MRNRSGKWGSNWKGGISPYPKTGVLKKHQMIIRMEHPSCESCGAPATDVHHKNKNKSDHRLSNLQALCSRCHLIRHGGFNIFGRKDFKKRLTIPEIIVLLDI